MCCTTPFRLLVCCWSQTLCFEFTRTIHFLDGGLCFLLVAPRSSFSEDPSRGSIAESWPTSPWFSWVSSVIHCTCGTGQSSRFLGSSTGVSCRSQYGWQECFSVLAWHGQPGVTLKTQSVLGARRGSRPPLC